MKSEWICLLIRVGMSFTYHQLRDVSLSMLREHHTRHGASHYYQWLSFHNQMNGAGQELLKEHGKFFGANFLRQVKCAESSYAVVAQKAAERIAQLYASVLAHVSNHVNSILFHSIIIITICTNAYNSLYFIYVQLTL